MRELALLLLASFLCANTPTVTNPNSYIEGKVISSVSVGDGMNLKIQPNGTHKSFTQEILFCSADDVEHEFIDKGNPVVLTYETATHRMIDGAGCHELVSVDEVALLPRPQRR